ncbi:hypothetical protein H2203_007088 [Taxawa tesnikishii (nom. ined.)]|nr:hypothetical protein H2203_007088 [Dothideales sp. JES 119]
MSMNELPETFRDAIQITRALGIRYLWIDALCIVQGDKEDWTREAAAMAAVYGSSRVTISALDSEDSMKGLFLTKQKTVWGVGPLPHCTDAAGFDAYVRSAQRTLDSVVERAPLNQRGWALQERIVAPRVLHFSKQQVFWECRTRYYAESGDSATVKPLLKTMYGWLPGLLGDLIDSDLYLSWYALVEDYTMRELTYDTDKLPAVLALAVEFEARLDCAYIHGLWNADLNRGLLWHTNAPHRIRSRRRSVPEPLRAPATI